MDRQTSSLQAEVSKKSYQTPELIVLGSVEKLTELTTAPAGSTMPIFRN